MSDEAVTGAANYCEFISPVNPTEKVLLARAGILVFTAALLVAMLAVTLKTIPAVSFMLGVILGFFAHGSCGSLLRLNMNIPSLPAPFFSIKYTAHARAKKSSNLAQATCFAPLHLKNCPLTKRTPKAFCGHAKKMTRMRSDCCIRSARKNAFS